MLNRILKFGTIIGVIVSITGFIFLKIFPEFDELNIIWERIYQFTLTCSALFILTISEFINKKFNVILKAVGVIFLIALIINLLMEFDIYRISKLSGEMRALILLCGLYFIYLKFFLEKNGKTKLDYLKITFLTIFFIGSFFIQYDIYSSVFRNISHILFWTVIIGILINEHNHSNLDQAVKNG